jgi:hypothetical protein
LFYFILFFEREKNMNWKTTQKEVMTTLLATKKKKSSFQIPEFMGRAR